MLDKSIATLALCAACLMPVAAYADEPIDAIPEEVFGENHPGIKVYQLAFTAARAARDAGLGLQAQAVAAKEAIESLPEVLSVYLSTSGLVLLIVLSTGEPMEYEIIPMPGEMY